MSRLYTALLGALLLAWGSNALAQATTATGTAPTSAQLDNGVMLTPQIAAVIGRDTSSGLPCVIGKTSTCQLPGYDSSSSGTITAVNGTVTVNTQGKSTVAIDVSADTNVTMAVKGYDGVAWTTLRAYPQSGAAVTTIASTGTWMVPVGGYQQLEVIGTAVGATPSATVALNAGSGVNTDVLLQAAQSAQSCNVATAPATGTNGQQLAVSCDKTGGLVPADGLVIPAASCSSACANTTLWQITSWPYRSVMVQVTSAGTTTTHTYQVSADGNNWVSTRCETTVGGAAASALVSTSTTAIALICDAPLAYFRDQITAYTSGTTTSEGVARATPPAFY